MPTQPLDHCRIGLSISARFVQQRGHFVERCSRLRDLSRTRLAVGEYTAYGMERLSLMFTEDRYVPPSCRAVYQLGGDRARP